MGYAGAEVDGKVVLITGGGTGIGAAVAERYAAEGAHVVVVGRRREPLDAVAERTGAAVVVGMRRMRRRPGPPSRTRSTASDA